MSKQKVFRCTALAIASLTGAVNAHGSTVVLPTAGFTCQYTEVTATGFPSCAAGVGAVAQLGVGGLTYSISPGGINLFGNASLQEGTFGQVATAMPAGTSIPYSYDFFLTETLNDPNWSLEITIFDDSLGGGSVIATTGLINGTYGTARTEFTSPGTMTTTLATNPNDTLTVEYLLDLTGVSGGGNPFTTVEVPAVDIQTITTSSTPEPGSWALFAGGLAWLGWKLRRRNGKVSSLRTVG